MIDSYSFIQKIGINYQVSSNESTWRFDYLVVLINFSYSFLDKSVLTLSLQLMILTVAGYDFIKVFFWNDWFWYRIMRGGWQVFTKPRVFVISVPESQTEAAASEFQEKLLLRDMDTSRIGDLPATVILMRFFLCHIYLHYG